MAKDLISFPSAAMVVPGDEWADVLAKSAVAEGDYLFSPALNGGLTVLELPSRDEAAARAACITDACRCDQEFRVFG